MFYTSLIRCLNFMRSLGLEIFDHDAFSARIELKILVYWISLVDYHFMFVVVNGRVKILETYTGLLDSNRKKMH